MNIKGFFPNLQFSFSHAAFKGHRSRGGRGVRKRPRSRWRWRILGKNLTKIFNFELHNGAKAFMNYLCQRKTREIWSYLFLFDAIWSNLILCVSLILAPISESTISCFIKESGQKSEDFWLTKWKISTDYSVPRKFICSF